MMGAAPNSDAATPGQMASTVGLVSVIVPTSNSARFLKACLDSIKNQTYRCIEIVVVDNHSTDATLQIAHRYTERVYIGGNERSAQVNIGASHAIGQYVYKVDSDFVLDAEVVGSCVLEIAKGFDAIVVHNSPDVRVGWIARVRKFEVDMYKNDLTHSSARFLRKVTFEALGGYDERITAGEDYDFQNRLNRSGYRTGFVEPEAIHLGEPTNLWNHLRKYFQYGENFVNYYAANPVESRQQLRFVRRVYVKNWRRFARHPILGMAFAAYSALKFLFGGAGFVIGTLKNSKHLVRER
jgi:glycosyltransferase involved in cell wall biosynthesis